MTETAEQEKGWIDKIKDDLLGLWNKIKEGINNLCGKEIFEVTTQTKKDLKKLEDDILKIDNSKLNDNEVEQNVEGKIDDEKTILGFLAKSNEDIKNWFNWLKDIGDEDTVSREIENILLMVKNLSNNDSDNSKGDLTETELKQIGTFAKNKMNLCDEVLKSDDIKELPDDKKTKKEILSIYKDLLSENSGDTSKIKKEDIINKMKAQTEQEQPTE